MPKKPPQLHKFLTVIRCLNVSRNQTPLARGPSYESRETLRLGIAFSSKLLLPQRLFWLPQTHPQNTLPTFVPGSSLFATWTWLCSWARPLASRGHAVLSYCTEKITGFHSSNGRLSPQLSHLQSGKPLLHTPDFWGGHREQHSQPRLRPASALSSSRCFLKAGCPQNHFKEPFGRARKKPRSLTVRDFSPCRKPLHFRDLI